VSDTDVAWTYSFNGLGAGAGELCDAEGKSWGWNFRPPAGGLSFYAGRIDFYGIVLAPSRFDVLQQANDGSSARDPLVVTMTCAGFRNRGVSARAGNNPAHVLSATLAGDTITLTLNASFLNPTTANTVSGFDIVVSAAGRRAREGCMCAGACEHALPCQRCCGAAARPCCDRGWC
jgi:hypothetical protein